MSTARWTVRTSAAAQDDFTRIVADSERLFGANQARRYATLMIEAFVDLQSGPNLPGSVVRAGVGPDMRTLRIGRRGHRGRHMLLYRVIAPSEIEVLRILHDRMDVARHVPLDPP